jgi:eukaryotic-like serine/threonine-protein kinase
VKPPPSKAPPSIKVPPSMKPPLSMGPPPSIRPPASMRPSAAPSRPTRLGRYDIVAKIAGGGMAAIYLARASDAPEQIVAIKAMRQELRSDETLEHMFKDEAALLSRLVHPNIVRTFEHGTGNDDLPFIAMELLLGKTLASVWDTCVEKNLRIDPDVVAYIGARVGDALHHAHEAKDDRGRPLEVIHRDVNPSNVFVTFAGEIKLFDFGMAKAVERRVQSSPGIVKGKLPYLAPEQIMQLPLDRRADVFGLGTTLWEMLTNRRLFRRDTDVETVRAVHVGPIPDPKSVVPDLPSQLVEIVKKALERNREHRFFTAAAMAAELDAFLDVRASHAPARIGGMLDALFPGERKRQMGWLKPAITGAGPSSRR